MSVLLSGWLVFQLLAIFSLILTVFYIYFKYVLYSYWKKKGVVHMKPSVPFGNLGSNIMGKISIGEIYEKAYTQYKNNGYFGMYTFYKPSLVICDPDLIRAVLTKNFINFHDRGLYCNEKIDPLGAHLFFLPGAKWKNLRVKLTPVFTSGKMKHMFDILSNCANKLSEYVEKIAAKEGQVEMKELTARIGTDVIVSTAFGLECDSLKEPNNEFRYWGKKALEPKIVRNAMVLFAPKVMDFLSLPLTDKDVAEFFTKAFKDNVEYRLKNNIIRSDLLNLLMQLMKKGYVDNDEKKTQSISESISGKITMEEGLAQAYVFFLAGFETTASAITYCLYELSRKINIKIQEKTRMDINQVLKKYNGVITYEALAEMTYLGQVVNETLRLYPPVPILNRVCTKDIELPNTNLKITKGIDLVIPILGLHRDSNYYPNPMKFDPERFNDVNTAARHPYAYLPFGEGPRVCIGSRFGLIQTKIVLASLLSKFKFTLAPETPEPLEYDPGQVILTAKSGIQLKIQPR